MAAISINLILGDDGIFGKAVDAKNKWEQAEQNDLDALNSLYGQMENILNGTGSGTGGNTTDPEEPTGTKTYENADKSGENGTLTENATYTDNGKTAIIPKGFKVSEVVTEQTIDDGLVIKDEIGNEFVWIPVEDYSKFHLIEGYSSGSLQTYLSGATNPSREAGSTGTAGVPLPNNNVAGTDESKAMYASVEANKGFYIARYEAGIEGTTANYNLASSDRKPTDGSYMPLSKPGVGVWNYIPWGGTYTDVNQADGLPGDETANGAVKVARSMYPDSDTTHGVTSTLCYGVQWDAVMSFIDSNHGKAVGENGISANSFVVNSTNKGNYSGSIAVTGSNINYQVKNIYDLAGNVYEWTMEAYNTNRRVSRGGYFSSDVSDIPASDRSFTDPDNTNYHLGFRVALYL